MIEGTLDNQCASGGKNVAAIVLEPIQGWGGTIIPPADFLPAQDPAASSALSPSAWPEPEPPGGAVLSVLPKPLP